MSMLTPEQAERIDKWVEALESGKYKQGQSRLQDDGCFCCLGVLCDISGVGRWDEDATGTFYVLNDSGFDLPFDSRAEALLPRRVAEWAGVPPMFGPEVQGESLTRLNDHGTPFADIAARIRKWKAEECEVVQ